MSEDCCGPASLRSASLAAAVLHVSAAADHRGMAGHVAFFLAVAAAQSALAAAVLLSPRRPLAGASRSRQPGRGRRLGALPHDRAAGRRHSAPEAIGFKDGISTMLEIGVAAGAGCGGCSPTAPGVSLSRPAAWRTVLGTGVWAVGAPVSSPGTPTAPDTPTAGEHAHATRRPPTPLPRGTLTRPPRRPRPIHHGGVGAGLSTTGRPRRGTRARRTIPPRHHEPGGSAHGRPDTSGPAAGTPPDHHHAREPRARSTTVPPAIATTTPRPTPGRPGPRSRRDHRPRQ